VNSHTDEAFFLMLLVQTPHNPIQGSLTRAISASKDFGSSNTADGRRDAAEFRIRDSLHQRPESLEEEHRSDCIDGHVESYIFGSRAEHRTHRRGNACICDNSVHAVEAGAANEALTNGKGVLRNAAVEYEDVILAARAKNATGKLGLE
jgi:hypothetical protein